jgi:SAM-dependent methyltransferase
VRSPDYSRFAKAYARTRPTYPAELFERLASLAESRRLAWDCATGNGQAAVELVAHFERVIATDVSAEQLRQASAHTRIEYRVAAAEDSGLDPRSADLVTVASALHWFDLNRFYAEARRVIRPGGLLAAWTYHVAHVEPPYGAILSRFYRDVVAPYFAPGATLVDDRYASIQLPGEGVGVGSFFATAAWNLDQLLAFIEHWSGTQQYIQDRRENPVALVAGELAELWDGRESTHLLRWPLYIRAARL